MCWAFRLFRRKVTQTSEETGGNANYYIFRAPRKKSTKDKDERELLEPLSGPLSEQSLKQIQLHHFKLRLKRNVSTQLKYYEECMKRWKDNHPEMSDSQITESHLKYRQSSCNGFISLYYDHINAENSALTEVILEHYRDLEGKIDSRLNGYLEVKFLNIGIYLDEEKVLVGVSKNYRETQILLEVPSEIHFSSEKFTIGRDSVPESHTLNIVELIKSPPTADQTIYFLPNDKSKLPQNITTPPEEILALFFKKLLDQLLKETGRIENIVLSSPLTLTSFEKSRLLQSLQISGFENVRVISSSLATAVVYTGDIFYHLKEVKEVKMVLIVHYSQSSFSMSMIQVLPNGIITKSSIGSDNLAEGQDKTFLHAHQSLFQHEAVTVDQENLIRLTYKKAIQSLSSEVDRKELNGVIIIEENENLSGIHSIFQQIFGRNFRVRLLKEGPLAGACVLASSANLSSLILPSFVKVLDTSRANLTFRVSTPNAPNSTKQFQVKFRNKPFMPGPAFSLSLSVPTGGSMVDVHEVYLKGLEPKLVGRYQINLKNQRVVHESEVKLRFWRTQDGVLSVDGELVGNSSGYVRVESRFGSCGRKTLEECALWMRYKALEDKRTPYANQTELRVESFSANNTKKEFDFSVRTPSPKSANSDTADDNSVTSETVFSTSSDSISESAPEFPQQSEISPEIPQHSKLLPEFPQHSEILPEFPQHSEIRPEFPQHSESPPEFSQESKNPPEISQKSEILLLDLATKIQIINQTLENALKESSKFQDKSMFELTDSTKPFTEKQIQDYHEENLVHIQTAFTEVFSQTLLPLPDGKENETNPVQPLEEKLIEKLQSQSLIYLKRHEMKIGDIVKMLKTWTLEGEAFYEQAMNDFMPQDKSAEEILIEHERLVKEIMTNFEEKVKEKSMEWWDELCLELKIKLNDKLQEVLDKDKIDCK